MIAIESDSVAVAIISGVSIIVVSAISYLGVKVTSSAKKAEAAGIVAVDTATRVDDKLATKNGKEIGETVHDIATMQELLASRLHFNTSEILRLNEELRSHGSELSRHIAMVRNRERELDPFFEDIRRFMEDHQNGT